MNDISEQRPSFFEGEFLSASDLEQLVIYLRDQSSRHLLGGHTWGIVAGLQLLEQPAPDGSVDVYLLPGYAVDGYGRPIVVVNPVRLSVDRFNGQPSGKVQVWLRYDEGQTNATRPGFQVCCDGGDAYSRVAESYEYEVGNKSLASQQSGISVGGETVDDARTAPRVFNDVGPVVCDASVPYQDLPLADDTKSHWLISLGEVGWKDGAPGQFQPLIDPSDPDNAESVLYSRRLRRYAGVVAENVFAADGLIRLRARSTEVSDDDQKTVDTACGGGDLTDEKHDKDFTNCAGSPTPNELVWVEGRLRVEGDARILSPGRLELRDAKSTNYYPTKVQGNVPTFLQRTDYVTGTTNNADLAIVIGKAEDTSTHNRLLIQQATNPKEPAACESVGFDPFLSLVTVQDTGNVGIGTETPSELLDLVGAETAYIHLTDKDGGAEMFVGAGAYGGVIGTKGSGSASSLRFRTGGTDPTDDGTDPTKDTQARMIILGTGQVGIGTPDPNTSHQVTIEAQSTSSLIARTIDGPHEVLLQADGSGSRLIANTENDQLILGANGGDEIIYVKADGRVGINQDSPGHDLSIKGASKAEIGVLASQGTNRRLLLGADSSGVYAGSNTNHDFQLQTNGANCVMIKTDGKVGIGTDSPATKLEVRGAIKLGDNGEYETPGGLDRWAMLAGSVPAGVGVTLGKGWQSHKGVLSDYNIIFTPGFSAPPLVTVTLVGSTGFGVPIPVITGSSNDGFTVGMSGGSEFAFNFIALAPR